MADAAVSIASEVDGQVDRVDEVLAAAFETRKEADLVQRLRADGDLYTAHVALNASGNAVGCAQSSLLRCPDEWGLRGVGLGPVAVLEDWRRHGIGTRLAAAAIDACKAAGADFMVVLGSPAFYGRLGFKPASNFELTSVYQGAGSAFQALELRPGALQTVSGTVQYCAAFDGVE